MADFIVTRKSDGEEVLRYSAAMAQAVNGFDLIDYDHTEIVTEPIEPDTRVFGGRRHLTKLEFVALLGNAYVALLAMAKQSVEIEAFVKLIDWATPDANTGYSIDLDDPRMAQLQVLEPALVAQGVVVEGWASGVLNG